MDLDRVAGLDKKLENESADVWADFIRVNEIPYSSKSIFNENAGGGKYDAEASGATCEGRDCVGIGVTAKAIDWDGIAVVKM